MTSINLEVQVRENGQKIIRGNQGILNKENYHRLCRTDL
jgi:hypothetical protein